MPGDEVAGLAVPDRDAEPADARRDDRRAAGHRLQRHEAEALVVGGHDADVGGVVVERQLVVADGPDEARRGRRCRGRRSGACRWRISSVRVAVAADDEHAEVGLVVELRGGAEEDVDALQRLDAADEEDHPLAVQAEGASRRLLVERAEAVEVDAAGHDGDAVVGSAP